MSKSRFNRHIGNKKGQALRWRASRDSNLGPLRDSLTRQLQRATNRAYAWGRMSGENALRDDHGIIPRKVRRDMAREAVRRARGR